MEPLPPSDPATPAIDVASQQTVSEFAHRLALIVDSCNLYIKNQVPAHAEAVIQAATALVEQYHLTKDAHIQEVVGELQAILTRYQTADGSIDPDSEAEQIAAIRAATDIIEAKNLVLTYQAPRS